MNGYVDLQINGYAGVDFNDEDLTADDLHSACKKLREDQVEGILLTLITDSVESLHAKIANVVKICESNPEIASMVWGLHIEGPFISPDRGYIGAHPAKHAQLADRDEMNRLLEAGQGMVKLVTLAPEMDPNQTVIRSLADAGIIVSGGHSNASRDDLVAAIDAGLTMFTHLGNGCPPQMDRHDNIISRVLSLSDHLWISFIADGAHIPFFGLRNYLKITGFERVIIVTDAIAAAGKKPGIYRIGDRAVNVGEDGVPRSEDGTHLVGSGTIMSRMAANLREELLLTQAQIDLLTKENPRKLLSFRVNHAPLP